MIEEAALILECDGDYAEVETMRLSTSACNTCAAKPACDTAALKENTADAQDVVLRVLNPIDAQPGERVVIGFEEEALTKASMAFYVVPLVSFILFALLGQWFAMWLEISAEPVAVLGGIIGLVLGLLWLRRFAEKADKNEQYQAVILRRVDESKISVNCDDLNLQFRAE